MSIYLDNGATSFPKAPGVGEAMLDYVNNIGANVNRSTYEASSEAEMVLLLRRAQEHEESQKNDTQASELLLLRERAASLEEVGVNTRAEG